MCMCSGMDYGQSPGWQNSGTCSGGMNSGGTCSNSSHCPPCPAGSANPGSCGNCYSGGGGSGGGGGFHPKETRIRRATAPQVPIKRRGGKGWARKKFNTGGHTHQTTPYWHTHQQAMYHTHDLPEGGQTLPMGLTDWDRPNHPQYDGPGGRGFGMPDGTAMNQSVAGTSVTVDTPQGPTSEFTQTPFLYVSPYHNYQPTAGTGGHGHPQAVHSRRGRAGGAGRYQRGGRVRRRR